MDNTHIFALEDSFFVGKKGLVLVGNCLVPKIAFLSNQQLELELPNGEIAATEIIGVDYFTKCFAENQAIGVLITLQQKEQAPLGAKVYLR